MANAIAANTHPPQQEDWADIRQWAEEIYFTSDNLDVKANRLVQKCSQEGFSITDEDARMQLAAVCDFGNSQDGANPDLVPIDADDDTLSREFVLQHPHLRHVTKLGRWYTWNGQMWQEDETAGIYENIKRYLRGFVIELKHSDAIKRTVRRNLLQSPRVASLERYIRSCPEYAMRVNEWDAHNWLLSTPGGIVDLRTGKLRPARPEDYCLQHTAVTPAEGPCPLWMGFLEKVTGNDAEMIAYLQRQAGYFLTGATTEHALFFFFGPGGNGKTTYLETLAGIMGDYAKPLPLGTLLESKSERHPTELADVRSCRLVVTGEVADSKAWDSAKVKYLTGGDTIKARFMRCDFFEYRPKFKICVAGNSKPALARVDDAMQRRLHMNPFLTRIDPPDRDFMDKLKPEWPQILAWMIRGCLEWQRGGLQPCARVLTETQQYFEQADKIGQFLAEKCVVDLRRTDTVRETVKNLWNAWRSHCQEADEQPGKRDDFFEDLSRRGIQPGRTNVAHIRKGIRLRELPTPDLRQFAEEELRN